MMKHCENIVQVVLRNLNKSDLGNMWLNSFDKITSSSQLTSGSDFNRRWQSTHLSGIFGGRGKFENCI